MKVDYIAMMQGYCGSNNDGFLREVRYRYTGRTDEPIPIQLSDDDYVKVRYDAKAMR